MPIVIGPIPVQVPEAGSGLSTLTVENLLEDVSLALIEPIVVAVLGTNITAGLQTVSPNFMTGIYAGALLVVGSAASNNLEVILVTDTTEDTFTAVFQFSHPAYDPVFGATFPSGFPDHMLFTQTEILGYLTDVQNDFLLKTRCIMEVTGTGSAPANVPFTVGDRFYAQPSQAIRVERLARIVGGLTTIDLLETTQSDLDFQDYSWTSLADIPQQWFRDQIDTSQLGLYPIPNTGGTLEAWYSKRGATGIYTLLSTLLVPDVMAHFIKYGILARCWSKEGEMRDPQRAAYCQQRFDFGVKLAKRFMEGIALQVQQNG